MFTNFEFREFPIAQKHYSRFLNILPKKINKLVLEIKLENFSNDSEESEFIVGTDPYIMRLAKKS